MARTFVLLSLFGLAACAATDSSGLDRKSSRDAAGFNAQLGIEYMKKGNLTDARDKIEKALKQDPQNADVQFAGGLLYQRLGDNVKADRHYEAALKLNPNEPEMLNTYGVFLCGQKRVEEGEKLFLKAARNPLYRTPAVAYNNAGVCLRDAGKAAEAQAYFEKARAVRPAFRETAAR